MPSARAGHAPSIVARMRRRYQNKESQEILHDPHFTLLSQPTSHAGTNYVHHETFKRKRQKSQKTGRRHLKYLPSLQNGKRVMPLCVCPIVPKFP